MPWIPGKALADERRARLQEQLRASNETPGLAVLLVGEDPASHLYARLKERAAQEAGIHTVIDRREHATTEELVARLHEWNTDPSIHGILVQLPLPENIDTDAVVHAIDPQKDADGFHPERRKALLEGGADLFPPVYMAILLLLGATPLPIKGQKALILAKSAFFAEPLQALLRRAGAFPEWRERLPDRYRLPEYGIILSALDQPGSLHGADLAEEAVIIDISTNKTSSGTVGDFDAQSLKPTQYASPVPGGVGPLTIACLLENVVTLAERQARPPEEKKV